MFESEGEEEREGKAVWRRKMMMKRRNWRKTKIGRTGARESERKKEGEAESTTKNTEEK